MNKYEAFDEKYTSFVYAIDPADAASEETTAAIKNLILLSQAGPPTSDVEPAPITRWEKFKVGAAKALDNETTRVAIKATGAFAGVGLVVWSTIHRDHVLDRQALGQANTPPK